MVSTNSDSIFYENIDPASAHEAETKKILWFSFAFFGIFFSCISQYLQDCFVY